jgi:hypothetical protein
MALDSWPSLTEALGGARLLARLPGLLRHPIGPERARALLRRRFEERDTRFLTLVRRAVYDTPHSPYRALLARAGCAYGDLERLVSRDGIEGAPVVVGIDLASVREEAVNLGLSLDARGGRGWTHALWSVPGSSAIRPLLRLAACGAPPATWFSKVATDARGLHPRYRWSARVLRLGGALAGRSLPSPTHVSLDDPRPVARWMQDALRRGATPHAPPHDLQRREGHGWGDGVAGLRRDRRAGERAARPLRRRPDGLSVGRRRGRRG